MGEPTWVRGDRRALDPSDEGNPMYDNLELSRAARALSDDVMVEEAVDSPTSIPCGITISITLNC